MQAKGWSESEERLFLEALELFGRDWHKAAAHVGERIGSDLVTLLCMAANNLLNVPDAPVSHLLISCAPHTEDVPVAGTRDKKAFTSHAQKHFIKLCIADKPLPDKVIASGNPGGAGYTLSGLPLDPNSSSARSYGFKPEHLTSKLTQLILLRGSAA